MKKEIKVKVQLTEGFQERYTEACLKQLKKRETKKEAEGGSKQ